MDDLWKNNIYYGIGYVQNILLLVTVMGSIFSWKHSNKKAWLRGAGLLVASFCAGVLLNHLDNQVFSYIERLETTQSVGTVRVQVDNMVLTMVNVLRDTIPALISIGASIWLFQGNKKVKVFFSVLFLLAVSVLSDFGAEITWNFFPSGRNEYTRYYPVWYIRSLIDMIWMIITGLVYWNCFRMKLKKLLEIAQAQISNIVLLPCISYLVFEIVKGTLYTYSITINAIEPNVFLVAGIVRACVMVMYFLMYQAIFGVVSVGARAAQVKAELDVASRIQSSSLPSEFPAFPDRKDIDLYAAMHPAKEVGGDFYDFFFIDKDKLALLIADVSGKGVPAALFMMRGQSIIRNQALLGIEPGEIFRNANNQLVEHNQEGMFITAFLGILNVDTGELMFCNAGHNTPYLISRDGTVQRMEMDTGFVLAGLENMEFQTGTRTLGPGEKLVLYTDGVTEAVNQNLAMYEETRLVETLSRCPGSPAQATVEQIVSSVYDFAEGADQADDITVLVAARA